MTSQRILWIGGSFGGLASIKKFVQLFSEIKPTPTKQFDLYIIDPRAGFINLLGIPRAIIDVDFAKAIYSNVSNYNFNFETVESNYDDIKEKILNAKKNESIPSNLHFHFIHGKCLQFIDHNTIKYQLSSEDDANADISEKLLKFDYAIFSTGRKRNWPYDPIGRTKEEFAKEVETFKPTVEKAKTIAIVGAGALGIELAGEIAEYYKGSKKIILIHPHSDLPPEIYATPKFKDEVRKLIENSVGIDLKLNTRIEKELENGNLLTTDGRIIEADLTLWSNSHKNNIEPLLPIFKEYIDPVSKEVIVDSRQLMIGSGCNNVFVVGDIVKRDVIKTAGSAWRQGQHVSQTLINFLVLNKKEYDEAEMDPAKGMTIVVGTEHCVSQWNDIGEGKIVLDDKDNLGYYKDYCTSSTKGLLNID